MGDFSWTSVGVASVFGFGGSLVGLVASLILSFVEAAIGELMEWVESEFNFNFLSITQHNYI